MSKYEHGTRERYNTCRIRDGRPCWACIQAARVWAEAWFQKNQALIPTPEEMDTL